MSSTRLFSGSWLFALGGGLITVLVFRLWRGFFWSHAIIIGLAVAALLYSAWRTWEKVVRGKA